MLQIIDPVIPADMYMFRVTGSVVDGTGYRKLTVAYVSGTGTFNVGTPSTIAFFPKGDAGTGASLADGDYGDIVVSGAGTVLGIDPAVLSAYGRTLADDANAAAAQTTLGISAFAQTILDDANDAAVRATIGAGTGSGDVTAAAAFATDNRLLRSDGTGKGAQASPVALTDAGALSGITTLETSGGIELGHATDTTLSRVSAGKIAVESKNVLLASLTETISVGYTVTPASIGSIPSSFTPNPALGNYQYGSNDGAATWNAPASDCAIEIQVTNVAGAGAVTFSGYTVGSNTGDALTTTVGHYFRISISRINAISTYVVRALQ